ncbi:HAD family hydrolase [Corynebacterium sp.]|uniref:HAD family hydrolase n=1 Tax=Corynebacterium sp. TaxID=1720 RepID=UPI003B3A9912
MTKLMVSDSIRAGKMAGMKAILWDMDGTLVDTEPRWGEATYAMAAAMGRELTPAVRAETVGGTADGTVRRCARWAGLEPTDDEVDRWISWLYARVSVLFGQGLDLLPGVHGLLSEGRDAQLPMMVVTNTFRSLTDQALETVGGDFFVGSVCGDEVSAGKPDPMSYLTAARRLDVAPDDCLVFEDSTNGMRAAVAAGCRVVGLPADGAAVPEGAVPVSSLRDGRTDLSGLGLSDLHAFWEQLGRSRVG